MITAFLFQTAMSRYKRTEVIRFPATDQGNSLQSYWGKLADPVTIQEYGAINTVHICPTDQNVVACTAYSKVQLYNVATVELHKSLTKFKDACFSGRFRQDGGLICAGTGEGGVKVFDVNSKTQLRVLSGHSAAVQRCDFLAGAGGGPGMGVVSWSDDSSVKVWDLSTESCTATLQGHTDYVRAGCVCQEQPDLLVSGGYDHAVKVWDRREDGSNPSMALQHSGPVEEVLVLPGGGLLVAAGGAEVRVWDLAASRLLATFSPHHKTVTCMVVAGSGRCLVTGGLDRQLAWTDLSTFRQVHTRPCPASVMSVGLGSKDDYLVVGMLDGLVQIHKRREEKIEDGMRVDGKRHRKARNHRYLAHCQFTPGPGDLVVGEASKDYELRHDQLLRKFEYGRALDAVLKPYVARKKPEYTYSLLAELVRRDGLRRALAGREEKQLCSLLQFLNKHLTDLRFSALLLHVSDLLVELYLPAHGMSSRVDQLFSSMKRKLEREAQYMETLMELQGAVDLVLSAAARADDKSPPVLHTVANLPNSPA